MSSLYEKNNKTFEIFKRILFCTIGAIIIGFNIKSFVRTGGLFPGGFAGITLLIQRSLDAFLNLHRNQMAWQKFYILFNICNRPKQYCRRHFTRYSIDLWHPSNSNLRWNYQRCCNLDLSSRRCQCRWNWLYLNLFFRKKRQGCMELHFARKCPSSHCRRCFVWCWQGNVFDNISILYHPSYSKSFQAV